MGYLLLLASAYENVKVSPSNVKTDHDVDAMLTTSLSRSIVVVNTTVVIDD